jgi:hypothetical protein
MAVQKSFVVKNGLEVATDLIIANDANNTVGIATTNVKYTLHVNGGIGVTNLVVSGITTISSLVLPGSVSVGATAFGGVSGQYLKSTGTGVAWEDFPLGRSSINLVASAGQSVFNIAYSVGLVDVFINGIKLSPSEFTANDGVTIVLAEDCFGGENVDILAYAVQGLGVGGTGITGLTIQDEGVTVGNPQGVTSINFVGAAVTAAVSGAGLTVTISGSGGSGGDAYWEATSSGINTLSNVGIGTTNPRFALEVGSVGSSGTSLWVNGDARITGILTVGTASITIDGNSNTLTVPNLVVTNSTSGVTASGVGITVRDGGGDLGAASVIDFGDNLSVSFAAGIATITGSAGGGTSSQWTTTLSGIHTLSNVGIGTTNPTSALTVKGNTSLETLNVSGVSTFTRPITVTGSQYSIFGNGLLVQGTAVSDLNGNNFAVQLQNGLQITSGSVEKAYISAVNGDILTVGRITAFNGVSVSGVSTFAGITTVTGPTLFTKQLNVSGVSTLGIVTTGNIYSTGIITATTFVGNFSGSITDATNLTGGYANASQLNVLGIATISQGRIQADASSNLRFGNIAAGSGSLRNIAIGDQVLVSLSGGQGRNIGIGELSYYDTTTGQYNIGIGERAGQKVSTGSYNVVIGAYDGNSGGLDIRTSSRNVVIADGEGNIRQYINSSGNVGIKTTVVTEALTVAGIVSATGFYGTLNAEQLTGSLPAIDGSALIGVVGSGSGVIIEEDGTPVGTAGTINFGSNLSVSFASGIATVSGVSSVSEATTAYVLAGTPNLNVGVVTATTLNVTGDRLVLPRGTSKGIHFGVPPYDDGANDSVIFVSDGVTNAGELVLNSGDYNTKIIAPNLVVRTNNTDQCSIGGSISSFILSSVGIGTTNATSKLDVSGNVKVSGIITATSFSGSGANLTNLPAGQLTGVLPAIDGSALLNVTASGTGIVVEDDNVNVGSAVTVNFGTGLDVTFSAGIATITSSGGSLQSRTTVSGVTTSISNNGIGNTNITGFKSYALMRVGLSTAGWLRIYTDSASRDADVSRSQGEDPAPGSGVIAEVVTTGISTTQIISPFVMGGNLDNPADTTIYASIKNLSGSTQAITANLTILQLEA